MSEVVIDAVGVAKKYRLSAGGPRYKTLRDSVSNGVRAIVGRGSADGKAAAEQAQTLWALNGVSFQIRRGEVVGIIGRNGAGKSTLLKILSRITTPTLGYIDVTGRVGSLLEVGTGFHPELSGRENIYLNGAILGMTRAEVTRRFDEIVAFSGVERFLDLPAKRYSSGMYMRLAFAVAAHMEPEILVVDEVLAVGDAEFQKKCLGKMGDVARQGRTVLLVSHNMGAVSSLCSRGILLSQGKVAFDGSAADAVRLYTASPDHAGAEEWTGMAGDEQLSLRRTWVKSLGPDGVFDCGYPIEIGIEASLAKPIDGLICGFTLWSQFGYELAYVLFDDAAAPPSTPVPAGTLRRTFVIPANTLAAGTYRVEFDLGIHMVRGLQTGAAALNFTLENLTGAGRRFVTPPVRGRVGLFRPAGFAQDAQGNA